MKRRKKRSKFILLDSIELFHITSMQEFTKGEEGSQKGR
jgi:hypothetical protein